MKRLLTAPNLVVAQLWADLLNQAGISATVERRYASGMTGFIPPDEAMPELWVEEGVDLAHAHTVLQSLRHPPQRYWVCRACLEAVEGPFEQCWNCGAPMPD